MILAVCSHCGDQMFLLEVRVKDVDKDHFAHIYILSCENNHKIIVEGDSVRKPKGRNLLSLTIKYLLESRTLNEIDSN